MSITEYLEYQSKYQKLYGPKTIVLLQCGIFYETYEYDPNYCTDDQYKIDGTGKIWNEKIGLSLELSTVLNFEAKVVDSKPYGIKNPHKLGFPLIAYDKCLKTLLANDYLVVLVNQNGTGANVTRYVAEVISPTMCIENVPLSRATSNVACLYIEYQKGSSNYENFLVTCGISVIDIITGQNKICEYYSKLEDQVYAVQELYRFLVSHCPRELIIHLGDMPSGLDINTEDNPNKYVKYLERVLELKRFDRLTIHINSVPAEYKKIPYQIEFLNKVFTKQPEKKLAGLNIIQKRNEKIISELGLENMIYGRIAYLLLLQHCRSHNSKMIEKISNPDLNWLDDKHHLILTHNAIIQLDLVPQKENRRKSEIDSLYAVLDHNRTHLGRRALLNMLQNPMVNPNEIQLYYNMTEEMLGQTNNEPLWLILDRLLKELPDIAKFQRKLQLKLIKPKELSLLYLAYTKIVNIYVIILNSNSPVLHSKLMVPEEVNNFNDFIAKFGSFVDFEVLGNCSVETDENKDKILEFVKVPLKKGFYPSIDELNDRFTVAEYNLNIIISHLNEFMSKTQGKKLKVESINAARGVGAKKVTDKITVLLTTNAKANNLLGSRYDANIVGKLQMMTHSTNEKRLVSDKIVYYSQEMDEARNELRKQLHTIYETMINEMVDKYNFYTALAGLVAKIDLLHTYALVATKNNYYKPEIDSSDGASYFEMKDLRHPVIEKLIDEKYVVNDLSLGRNDLVTNRSCGALAFGLNASGKSSLIKAVGLNIIMAQSGLFTPSKLKYKPYIKILTRLSANDNMFAGLSSFMVEMGELRTIIRQADEHSLILSEEIAKGSEINSATSIVVSTVNHLIEKKSTFLSSTHLHNLVDMPQIKNINQSLLKIMHLSVENIEGILVYERKIRDGAGSSVYGLLVAETLGFPDNFINYAKEVLSYVIGESTNILDNKTSRFSSKVYMHECAICKKTNLQAELNSHHILEQNKADINGFIGHIHKNIKDNLIVLCKECHIDLHRKGIQFENISTSEGNLVVVK